MWERLRRDGSEAAQPYRNGVSHNAVDMVKVGSHVLL